MGLVGSEHFGTEFLVNPFMADAVELGHDHSRDGLADGSVGGGILLLRRKLRAQGCCSNAVACIKISHACRSEDIFCLRMANQRLTTTVMSSFCELYTFVDPGAEPVCHAWCKSCNDLTAG